MGHVRLNQKNGWEKNMNSKKNHRILAAIFATTLTTIAMLGSSGFASEPSTTATTADAPTVMVQTANGVVTPASVESCSKSAVTGGTKYSNCKVYTWVGSWSMSFYADFTIKNGSTPDSINAIRNWAWSWGGPVSQQSYTFAIGQATENSSGPAWARYTGVFTGPLIGTKTEWVGLWVGGNSYGQNNSAG
jgi:hypothetical protein